MNNQKAPSITTFLILLITVSFSIQAQTIESPKGYDDQVGALVSMMDDLKQRVRRSVSNLDQNGTDFLLDDDANRIGAMIMHLAATEYYYQVYTFENRGYNDEEAKKWNAALNLGDDGRSELIGKPIDYYLEQWDEVRKETKKLLKSKDDTWLSEKVNGTSMNNYWAWYHVMEHQANHMGQIRLILKRIE